MLGIGSTEFIIILFFGFLVFGPEKLPSMGRTVGRMIKQFRETSDEVNKKFKDEIYDPFQEAVQPVVTEVKSAVDPIQEAVAPIKEDLDAAKNSFSEITEPINEMKESFKDPLGIKEMRENFKDPLTAAVEADKATREADAAVVAADAAAASAVAKEVADVPLSAAKESSASIAASLYGLDDPFAEGGDN